MTRGAGRISQCIFDLVKEKKTLPFSSSPLQWQIGISVPHEITMPVVTSFHPITSYPLYLPILVLNIYIGS